jgi:multidrug efflux pump subunit AcrA (membrane-fusion protein)
MRIKASRQLVLPAAAFALFGFAVLSALRPEQGRAEPLIAPPTTPYVRAVSGVGVVEPESEIIAIGTELPGIVREVFVLPGAKVEAGAELFRLDARALEAARGEAVAARAAADAAVSIAAVNLADDQKRLAIFERVDDRRAISVDELDRLRFAARRSEASLARAQAEADAARARVAVVETDLERQVIRAPIKGEILSVDVRAGEFAPAGPLSTPLITIGATDRLHVRVEIDESDITRLRPGAKAVAVPRGSSRQLPLSFIRREPQVSAKRALAGGSERVDSRVVEVVFALEPGADVIVGQRLDVYVDEAPAASLKVAS